MEGYSIVALIVAVLLLQDKLFKFLFKTKVLLEDDPNDPFTKYMESKLQPKNKPEK